MATQILPYEPSPSEKRKQWFAENVFGTMDDRYRANRLSQGIVDTIDMIPGYGDIEGVREGYHMATEGGSPYIGAGIAALSGLPLVPGSMTRAGTDFLKEQAAKLRVTPTQYTVEKTDPMSQHQAVETERLIYSDREATEGPSEDLIVPPAFESMASEPPQIPIGGNTPQHWYNRTRAELATEGQPFTIETMAERSILKNPSYQNPYKKYNVQGLIQSTLKSVPGPARANVERQFNEWIPEEMKEGKATLQEVLDAIGSNKPRIHQQVDARPNAQLAREEIDDARSANTTPYIDRSSVVGGARSQTEAQNVGTIVDQQILDQASLKGMMPSIPTDGPVFSSADAARTLMPLKYTEKNVSVHSPNYGTLFQDPGHNIVGAAAKGEGYRNTANRIFTTRSGVYEIEGKRYLIPAEGQSGIYKFTKDEGAVRGRMTGIASDPNNPVDPLNISEIRSRLYNRQGAYPLLEDPRESLTSPDFLEEVTPRLREQHTIDDWKQEVAYWRRQGEDAEAEILYNRNLTPAGISGSASEVLRENKKQLRAKLAQYDDELERLENVQGEAIHEAEVRMSTNPYSTAREKYEREVQNINNDFYAQKEALQEQYVNEREAADELVLAQTDHVQTVSNELSAMLKPIPITKGGSTYPPLHKDWFPMHMKMSMNDAAVDPRIDGVRFPINDYAIQQQRGDRRSPARMRMFSEDFDDIPDPDNPDIVGQTLNTLPNEKAQNLGTIYERETNEAIKRIEAEYDIKLNGTVVEDDNLNKFLEIEMTPEIREAFQKVLMNKGGEVDKEADARSNRRIQMEQDFEEAGGGVGGLLASILNQDNMTVQQFNPSGELMGTDITLKGDLTGPAASRAREESERREGRKAARIRVFQRAGEEKFVDITDAEQALEAIKEGWTPQREQDANTVNTLYGQQGRDYSDKVSRPYNVDGEVVFLTDRELMDAHSSGRNVIGPATPAGTSMYEVDGNMVPMTEAEYNFLKGKFIQPNRQDRSGFNLGGTVDMNNRTMMPLQYFNQGGQSKDALDRGVEAYEESPIIAQIIAGETPAGFAADVASAAKYGRDAVRSVVSGQYGDALAPSIMSALSIVGLIPGIGALGTVGKKAAGQYLGKVRGSGDYGIQDTGHHAYRGFKLDPNIQGETAQYQDLARKIKEAEAQVPGGIENPQRSVTIPDPRSPGAQLSQAQGVSGGGRYIQGGPHPDDVYIQGPDGSVMLVNETTGTSRSIGIDGIPEGSPIRQPGGRMQVKDSTMPGGSRPLGGYARGGPVNRPLMNLRY